MAQGNLELESPSNEGLLAHEDRTTVGAQDVRPRAVSVSSAIAEEPQKPLQRGRMSEGLITVCYIGLWYAFSVSLSVYNKWMFAADRLDFRFPIFTTSLHQLVQFSLALLLTKDRSVLRIQNLKRALPCAAASTGDIGMGNVSLRVVTLSFYTMVKSSSLGFVLLFGVLFRLERATIQIATIVTVMTIGVIMMVAGETQFVLGGFFLVLGAAACSGLRWALTQILLRGAAAAPAPSTKSESAIDDEDEFDIEGDGSSERLRRLSAASATSRISRPAARDDEESGPAAQAVDPEVAIKVTEQQHTQHHRHPLQTMLLLSPSMFVMLLLLALGIEGPRQLVQAKLWTDMGILVGGLVLLFPGLLAFCMTLAEFILLNRTSVLTLAIAGICKEVVTITAAVIMFGDHLTLINGLGLVVTTAAILAYQQYRFGRGS